jgi:hypothetical protein
MHSSVENTAKPFRPKKTTGQSLLSLLCVLVCLAGNFSLSPHQQGRLFSHPNTSPSYNASQRVFQSLWKFCESALFIVMCSLGFFFYVFFLPCTFRLLPQENHTKYRHAHAYYEYLNVIKRTLMQQLRTKSPKELTITRFSVTVTPTIITYMLTKSVFARKRKKSHKYHSKPKAHGPNTPTQNLDRHMPQLIHDFTLHHRVQQSNK